MKNKLKNAMIKAIVKAWGSCTHCSVIVYRDGTISVTEPYTRHKNLNAFVLYTAEDLSKEDVDAESFAKGYLTALERWGYLDELTLKASKSYDQRIVRKL